MKLVLIADLSANGKLLLTDNPNHPVPQDSIDFYIQKVIHAGNLIIGRRTFEIFERDFGGVEQLFPGTEIVILSRNGKGANGYKIVNQPEEAIEYLESRGFGEIVIGGGVQVYDIYLNKGLSTDLYFTYVPVIVGDGGIIGTAIDLLNNFELKEYKLLSGGLMQMYFAKIHK